MKIGIADLEVLQPSGGHIGAGHDDVEATRSQIRLQRSPVDRHQLQARNGFRDAQIAYWIEGEPRASRTPRWNLIDNVLNPALGL